MYKNVEKPSVELRTFYLQGERSDHYTNHANWVWEWIHYWRTIFKLDFYANF